VRADALLQNWLPFEQALRCLVHFALRNHLTSCYWRLPLHLHIGGRSAKPLASILSYLNAIPNIDAFHVHIMHFVLVQLILISLERFNV
jgi:hypothetical protein